MIGNITPTELRAVDMLMYLQRIAGFSVGFEEAIEGWRALSPHAQQQLTTAFETAQFIKPGYSPIGGQHAGNPPSQSLQGATRGKRDDTHGN